MLPLAMADQQVRSFFDTYRETFARYDAAALADLFAFPLQVVSDAEEIAPLSIASREDWVGVLEGLLGGYRTIGVHSGEPLDIAATELTPRIVSAKVHW